MKKSIFILVLALLLLLTACGQQTAPTQAPDPTEGSTAATQPTQATEPDNTEPVLQLPQEGTAMDEAALDWFRHMFMSERDPYTVHPTNWYNMILGIQFDSPENINLRQLFYNGTRWNPVLSDEEQAYLTDQGFDLHYDVAVTALEDANAVLSYYLGLTWEETNGVGAEKWTYYDETQCFYKSTSDFLSWDYEILGGAVLEDGLIRLYYTLDFPGLEETVFAITLQGKTPMGETGYYVLSNLPVE